MKIEMLYFEGCPTYREVEALIEEVIRSEGTPAEVESLQVKTEEEAIQRGFLGSPTIRVEGVDNDPVARSSRDLASRGRSGGKWATPAAADSDEGPLPPWASRRWTCSTGVTCAAANEKSHSLSHPELKPCTCGKFPFPPRRVSRTAL
jgi:hypothetical protein